MSDVYYPHAIVFPSGNDITQLDGLPLEPGFEDLSVRSASSVFPSFTGNHSSEPMLDGSTTQIKDILDRCTVDGIAGAYSSSNVDIEWLKASSLTGRVSSGSLAHIRSRATHSLLSWDSISAAEGQTSEIQFKWQPISDGTNAPVTFSTGVALGGTSAVQHVFTLGKVALTTSSINKDLCVTRWTWQNNLTYKKVFCKGLGYVEHLSVATSDPVITVEVEDAVDPFALLPAGESLSALTLYLRKKQSGGINVANATAEHIKFTASVGSVRPAGPRSFRIRVHSFAIDTASAIT